MGEATLLAGLKPETAEKAKKTARVYQGHYFARAFVWDLFDVVPAFTTLFASIPTATFGEPLSIPAAFVVQRLIWLKTLALFHAMFSFSIIIVLIHLFSPPCHQLRSQTNG